RGEVRADGIVRSASTPHPQAGGVRAGPAGSRPREGGGTHGGRSRPHADPGRHPAVRRDERIGGLTTLTPDHAEVEGRRVVFSFSGQGRGEHEVALRDSRLASLISKCQDLGGPALFAYEVDDGVGTVGSADVNRYLSDTAGEGFSAKDFRTWGASAVVTGELAIVVDEDPDKSFLAAVDVAAERLGNTRDVCRNSYLHPVVREAFEDGRLRQAWRRSKKGRWLSRPESAFKRLIVV